jgi:hypothetical protein
MSLEDLSIYFAQFVAPALRVPKLFEIAQHSLVIVSLVSGPVGIPAGYFYVGPPNMVPNPDLDAVIPTYHQ